MCSGPGSPTEPFVAGLSTRPPSRCMSKTAASFASAVHALQHKVLDQTRIQFNQWLEIKTYKTWFPHTGGCPLPPAEFHYRGTWCRFKLGVKVTMKFGYLLPCLDNNWSSAPSSKTKIKNTQTVASRIPPGSFGSYAVCIQLNQKL